MQSIIEWINNEFNLSGFKSHFLRFHVMGIDNDFMSIDLCVTLTTKEWQFMS